MPRSDWPVPAIYVGPSALIVAICRRNIKCGFAISEVQGHAVNGIWCYACVHVRSGHGFVVACHICVLVVTQLLMGCIGARGVDLLGNTIYGDK